MQWYYTEGHLTVKVDGEEHKFSLEELIASERRPVTAEVASSSLVRSAIF